MVRTALQSSFLANAFQWALAPLGVFRRAPRPAAAQRRWLAALAALVFALGATTATAAPIVITDLPLYTVKPGQSFEVDVLIDGELGLPDIQPVPHGLFSVGWQMTFDSSKALVDSLTVAPQLDFFGFVPGALTSTGPGSVEAEGNIDQIGLLLPYTGALLGKISLTNLAPRGDSYVLQLALKQHFPTEQLFLDGQGNVLDPVLLFGSARVIVIPEPSSLGSLVLAVAMLLAYRRRRPAEA